MKQAASPIEVGGRKVTSLVVDFLQECAEYHKIRFHVPVIFGLRGNIGLRGLFLAENYKVKRNTPIFSIPYSGMLTPENVTQQPNALQISLDDVKNTVLDEEMQLLAPHLLFGIQMSHQISLLPKHGATLASLQNTTPDQAQYDATYKLFTGGIMPWSRMIDDENWVEDHVLGVHRGALDKWQLQDYVDLYNMCNRNITELHNKFNLNCSTDELRRITRVVVARTEQVPLESELTLPRWKKRWNKMYRYMLKSPPPKPQLCMIPLMDMLNHSNRANTMMRFFPDGEKVCGIKGPCVSLFALNDIDGGKELCRYYNFGMSRGNALFRYGFLPFEILALESYDPWKESYAKSIAPNLMPESPEEQKKREEIEREVAKLQETFKKARSSEGNEKK